MPKYTDLDLTFIPNPVAHERISGTGTISIINGSNIVTGQSTEFTRSLYQDLNLYVDNTFIGKIKSIESNTSLTLYSPVSISGSTEIYDDYDTNRLSTNSVSSTFTALLHEYDFIIKSSTAVSEGSTIRFEIITNCPLLVDPEIGTRLTNFNDPYIPVKYSIKGIDAFDVVGEYPRATNDPFRHNISDYMQGTLAFSPLVNYIADGYYSAYVEVQTTIDSEVEVMERAFIDFIIDGITLVSSNNNFMFSVPADITLKTDINAIKNSLKNIVRTAKYERMFNSHFGTDTSLLLFDYTSAYTMMVKRSIEIAIQEYEPRVNLNKVIVNITEDNTADISITFTILDSNEPYTFNLTLERTR